MDKMKLWFRKFSEAWTEAVVTGAVAACIAFVFEKFIIEKKGEYK